MGHGKKIECSAGGGESTSRKDFKGGKFNGTYAGIKSLHLPQIVGADIALHRRTADAHRCRLGSQKKHETAEWVRPENYGCGTPKNKKKKNRKKEERRRRKGRV